MNALTRKWTQGHSTGLGVLIGVSLVGYRGWLIFAAGVAAGLLLAFGFRFARTVQGGFEAWRDTSRAKAEQLRSTPEPVYSTRRRKGLVDEGVPF
jgi:hypothetical protein